MGPSNAPPFPGDTTGKNAKPSRKRAKYKPRQEILLRNFFVYATKQSVGLGVERRRGEEPALNKHSWLEFQARLEEPVAGTYLATISVFPEALDRPAPGPPPCVGSILSTKPEMQVVVPYPIEEFDRLWALATNSQVRTGHVVFTAPKRGSALVVNLGFSTDEAPEE